jgi:hypothetical protein
LTFKLCKNIGKNYKRNIKIGRNMAINDKEVAKTEERGAGQEVGV